jgi:hypothetical protein
MARSRLSGRVEMTFDALIEIIIEANAIIDVSEEESDDEFVQAPEDQGDDDIDDTF